MPLAGHSSSDLRIKMEFSSASVVDYWNQTNVYTSDSHSENVTPISDYGKTVNGSDVINTHFNYFNTPMTIVFAFLLAVSMFFAIFGNLMVIIVILKNRRMRNDCNKTNLFLLNLGVADLFVGVLMIPFSLITLIKGTWIFPKWFCTFNSFLITTCFLTSIHTLMYIAIHKCICISKMNYHFSRIKCYLMIAGAWSWGILFAIITTNILSKSIYKPKTTQCGPPYPDAEVKTYILHALNQTINLFIPFGIMTYAYIKIFRIKKRSDEFRRRNSITTGHSAQTHEDNGVSCTLFIVLICFLLCWAPYLFYINFATLIENKDDIPVFLNPLAYSFGYMNSACNPVIYAWRFPDFRRGYRDILCYKPAYVVTRGFDGRIIIRRRLSINSDTSNSHFTSQMTTHVAREQPIAMTSVSCCSHRKSSVESAVNSAVNSVTASLPNNLVVGPLKIGNGFNISHDVHGSARSRRLMLEVSSADNKKEFEIHTDKVMLSAANLTNVDIEDDVFLSNGV